MRKGEIVCFSQCFLPYMTFIFRFKCTLKCGLQFVSILTSLKFCRLVIDSTPFLQMVHAMYINIRANAYQLTRIIYLSTIQTVYFRLMAFFVFQVTTKHERHIETAFTFRLCLNFRRHVIDRFRYTLTCLRGLPVLL